MNQGDSTFQQEVTAGAISSDIDSSPTSIAVADVNGDDHIDIILGHDEQTPNQEVLLNQGNGTFVELEGSIPNDSSSEDFTPPLRYLQQT
jgi:hypothetical protein